MKNKQTHHQPHHNMVVAEALFTVWKFERIEEMNIHSVIYIVIL